MKNKKDNYERESKFPDCNKYLSISKKSSRKGFYYCKFKKSNIIFGIDCKNCEHIGEITKGFNKHLKKKELGKKILKNLIKKDG